MNDGMIGEIRLFGGTFAPRGWAFCDGQLLPISSYSAMFSILGTTYGGDGRTTFALPNLQSRVAIGAGHGPGLSDYRLGQSGGVEEVTLTEMHMPTHNHTIGANSGGGDDANPTGKVAAEAGEDIYHGTANASMQPTGRSGASRSHTNVQPYMGMHYIICLNGTFPSRS